MSKDRTFAQGLREFQNRKEAAEKAETKEKKDIEDKEKKRRQGQVDAVKP